MTINKVLIIQTAFLGDVILATGLVEKIISQAPETRIDFLLKKGNESILAHNPHVRNVLVFDKKNRIRNMLKLLATIRRERYDLVVNLHRFASSGLLAGFSGGKAITGFDKNPFSFLYTKKYRHQIGEKGVHEIDRNVELIKKYYKGERGLPKMYFSVREEEITSLYKKVRYVCLAPGSVWFTKRYPKKKWLELIHEIDPDLMIYFLGAPGEWDLCEDIRNECGRENAINLAGKLSITTSACLMKDAVLNFVNDSAPLHIASSVDAAVVAVFCSTIPAFGFGPVSSKSFILETKEVLSCRPCNLHGKTACPEGHFKCAFSINNSSVSGIINKQLDTNSV